jgi:phosphoesterase RecJ-like protein
MYGDINFVNPVAPACCEVLVGMFDYLGIEITKDIGTCIITGIITDTGGFNYNVNPETFDFAAMLLRKGVKVSDVYQKALKMKTRASFELNRIANERLEFLEGGKVVFTYITLEDEEKVGAKTGDHEGIVENGRDIEGVEVSILLHERKNKPNGFKISLRSSDYVNVSDVCLMFGGGGHTRAAGAFSLGTVEQIKEKLLVEIRKQLK